ncbi:MAG: hypothetical protein M3393_08960 [Actinomycetota bacterium]|nr:hypothetical protein [Actinomycetota bacterium]
MTTSNSFVGTTYFPSQSPYQSSECETLAVLLQQVVEARAHLSQERRRSATSTAPHESARAQVLVALKAYTAALAVQRLPIPYALRDELRMQQILCRPR